SSQDAEAGCVSDGLLSALLLLLGLPLLIAAGLLFRMMDRTSGACADLMYGADIATFGDDGLGSELAHLELGPLRVFLGLWLVVPNRCVLVPWQDTASVLLCAVGGADLYQFRLRGDSRRYVGLYFGLIAGG